jgi:uncharacterized protein
VLNAVLDTSVLVSAFITPRGVLGRVLDAARDGVFALHISREIQTETAAVLLREPKLQTRYGYGPEAVDGFRDSLPTFARLVADLPAGRFVPDDPVVATAVAARADYLVTGDRKHLLSVGAHGQTRIVTPRQFLDLL